MKIQEKQVFPRAVINKGEMSTHAYLQVSFPLSNPDLWISPTDRLSYYF